ncbi:uncharacterized protein MONBRDRAFT_34982 [Monosiga brevicollis MX1]|uniref:phosphoglucomutase (alpha-D-glucose-1,6-bisphosphate-dependent) n=1 Tax=Monosiga brevicollis TaxID=81824 RepID=A9UTG9_MONBE|nr:uncharacterized protein MONBRDRAFT_34982 [Monosiga brevicollis MX1]EDQ91492.1 predicted protein [Monosiga brevicollis MX1]|eukprot:XP_001743914.1 hypothetical protein [Monosiga brevicollis MX1]
MGVQEVPTQAFDDQKPGTSGLRKKVTVFQQPNYTNNFIQATIDAVTELEGSLAGATLAVGGDGRFYLPEAIQIIIKMAAANKIGRLVIGQNGLFSTPAVSALIRQRQLRGGIILTASHNPGGPTEDFGIKYNIANGGPAPGSVTDTIFKKSQALTKYQISDAADVDLSVLGEVRVEDMIVEIVDPVDNYATLMQELFDFDALKAYVSSGIKLHIDCLSGIAGPYAKRIYVDLLGAPEDAVVNASPKPDFGGGHPDPNLVYAHDLVAAMQTGAYDFGAAFDGDADRNMILGKNGFFVTPSDSVAVLAAQYEHIPYLKKNGLQGVSRSMPTGAALDLVAKKLDIEFFEVPTGWKFFGNLMDAGRLSLCGEESFGTGSNHIREKDGVWASLCWLSVMAGTGQSIEQILLKHWQDFGRNFFTRYDYENVSSEAGDAVMTKVRSLIGNQASWPTDAPSGHKIASVDDFEYTDPTNGEVTSKQGLRIIFTDGSRIIFRLSGTGSSGATIRMYIDSYIKDDAAYTQDAAVALKPLVELALQLSNLADLTGRTEPSVIT